ncbi:MAG: HAD family phosphatase, partial [Cyanobacteria bacterium SZAS TMP-1]|nr:HAD family phosphatase [Cyanobacteria bacterium SZAS TMP-1]
TQIILQSPAIRKLGLDLQISFNRGAVMVLPPGVNKASGLLTALDRLGISKHNVVGVGDAENDHIFLSMCECSVAVANATPLVKQMADWVLDRAESEGVCDLIDRLLANDLQRIDSQIRSKLAIGTSDGGSVSIDAYNSRVLIAGPSRTGKSRLTYGLLERLAAEQYQSCVVDPECDYDGFHGAVTLGTSSHPPTIEHVLLALNNPINSVVVNLVGLSFASRPEYFARLFNVLQDLRVSTGRPHWLIIEEAHHMLYPGWIHASEFVPKDFPGLLLVTVHPSELSSAILSLIDTVIATGSNAHEVINAFAKAAKLEIPRFERIPLARGDVLLWMRSSSATVTKVKVLPTIHEHRRHLRKYAEGDVGYQRSFFFTGPDYRLNLQASNMHIFVRIADGIDEATWLYHLNRGDYARWFEDVIKDHELAELAKSFADSRASAAQSRRAIRDFIRTRYTLPERSSHFD